MSKNHLINGRPWAECLKEIRLYKEKTKQKDGGRNGKSYGYYSIDEYIQRLDDVIGTDHYMVETDDFQKITLSKGQEMFVVRCKITIIDDEGDVIISKTAYGGTEVMYAKATDRADIGNAPGNACKDALKGAAELLGILGYHGYRQIKPASSPSQNKPPASMAADETPMKDVPMNLISEGAFFETGERDGKKIFKLASREMVSPEQVKKEIVEVIFYPNQYGKDTKRFNSFYAKAAKAATHYKALVQACGMRDGKPQYIFKGFAA